MSDIKRALVGDFLRDFTAKLDAEIMRPLGCVESGAKRGAIASGAGRDIEFPSTGHVNSVGPVSPAASIADPVEAAMTAIANILKLLTPHDRATVVTATHAVHHALHGAER